MSQPFSTWPPLFKLFLGACVVVTGTFFMSNFKTAEIFVKDLKISTAKLTDVVKMLSSQAKEDDNGPFTITLVTMFLSLGKFQKGGGDLYFDKKTYEKWLSPWGNVQNRVIAFFDSSEMAKLFSDLRENLPPDRTVVQVISRDKLKAFKQVPQIEKIYALPNYPKHPPNTVNANYSATMSAKYDAVEIAMQQGLVTSAHVAWIDLGYLREFTNRKRFHFNQSLTFEVPGDFNDSEIAYSKIGGDYVLEKTVFDIIKGNNVYVAGGFFLATPELVKKFTKDYRETVREMLDKNMASTDQQFIAALYSNQLNIKPSVPLKMNSCTKGDRWFCLGFKCIDAARDRRGNNPIPLTRGAENGPSLPLWLLGGAGGALCSIFIYSKIKNRFISKRINSYLK